MPYRPNERQYRNFAVEGFKSEAQESSEEQNYIVRGYFCTFREPYELFPNYYEEIDPNAFAGCDMSDVVMQMNHDGFVYARNRNGSLQITTDDHGGHIVADLGGSKQGREDLYEAIDNGLIDTMSFGFTIAEDGVEWEEDENGVIWTRITKVSKLYDVSAIAGFAANPGTEISARSLHDAIMEARNKEDKPLFSDDELDAIADALERRAKEREKPVDPDDVDPDDVEDETEDVEDVEDESDEKRECDEDDVEERDKEERMTLLRLRAKAMRVAAI